MKNLAGRWWFWLLVVVALMVLWLSVTGIIFATSSGSGGSGDIRPTTTG
jgi:hypothetical protein